MLFIRASLFYAIMVLTLLVVNTFAYLTRYALEPLGMVSRHTRIRWVQSFNRLMIEVIAPSVLGLRYRVCHAQYIPQTPAVYLMKHQSAWETIASVCFLPLHTWVLKHELLWVPLFGWGLRLVDPVAIIRADPTKAMKAIAKQGQERLNAGISIVIFPEGTRRAVHQMGEFKIGGAFLAKQCRALVVPVAHNAGHFWARRRFLKKPGTITVVIGKPFASEGLSTQAINARAEKWMRRMQKIIERESPQHE